MSEQATKRGIADLRLRGRWLFVTRQAWLLLVSIGVSTFIANLFVWYTGLLQVCSVEPCAEWQITPEAVQRLAALGASVRFYAMYQIGLVVVLGIVPWLVGALIFWRRSDDWMALFTALMLIFFGFSGDLSPLAAAFPSLRLLPQFVEFILQASLPLFFFLFPNGRFVPRWLRWIAVISVLWAVGIVFLADTPFDPEVWPAWLFAPLWLGQIRSIAHVSWLAGLFSDRRWHKALYNADTIVDRLRHPARAALGCGYPDQPHAGLRNVVGGACARLYRLRCALASSTRSPDWHL
jgi:hypothetical protein